MSDGVWSGERPKKMAFWCEHFDAPRLVPSDYKCPECEAKAGPYLYVTEIDPIEKTVTLRSNKSGVT